MGLPSPGYCCTLFQRDKREFILPLGLGIPTLKLKLDWKLLQVSSVGEEGNLALLGLSTQPTPPEGCLLTLEPQKLLIPMSCRSNFHLHLSGMVL